MIKLDLEILINYHFSMTDNGQEIGIGKKENIEKEYPRVDMGRGRLGMQISEPGGEFSLSDIFGVGAALLGGDKFTGVYLKTSSGNMYWIRENRDNLTGEIVNANESRKAHGRLDVISVESPELAKLKITVGEPFKYGNGTTTNVTEITAINDGRIYGQEALDQMTEGRKSTITTDFKTACLPIGAEPQK